MSKRKEYGIADKAWQVVVGCDPHMPCAPRCWARKTVARIVECQAGQHPERAAFFQIALSGDGKQWSGAVTLDRRHLTDPFSWRKPYVIATGFHGDWARLPEKDQSEILTVIRNCERHDFRMLTKAPGYLLEFLAGWRALGNMSIGFSVMNQQEADRMRQAVAVISGMGWRTHVWYEPAIGPVNWQGWEFLELIIAGGESGSKARPANPKWFRDTRDFCQSNGIAFKFKQWGDWAPDESLDSPAPRHRFDSGELVYRVGKRAAGDLLDGILHTGEVSR